MEPSDPATIFEVEIVGFVMNHLGAISLVLIVAALVQFLDWLGNPVRKRRNGK